MPDLSDLTYLAITEKHECRPPVHYTELYERTCQQTSGLVVTKPDFKEYKLMNYLLARLK